MDLAIHVHLRGHALGRPLQRQFPQRYQISFGEKIGQSPVGLGRHIHFAFPQPFQQIVGREVDQLDFIGAVEERVGHGFADHHARDLGHHVVEAFQVLDVERRVNVEPRVEQPIDILPALGVRGAGSIGVGRFIDDNQLRLGCQRRLQIEFQQLGAAIIDFAACQHVQAEHKRLGFRASMGLDVAHQHVDPFLGHFAGRLEHRIRLADTGAAPKKIFSLPRVALALIGLHSRQQLIGIGTLVGHVRDVGKEELRQAPLRLHGNHRRRSQPLSVSHGRRVVGAGP